MFQRCQYFALRKRMGSEAGHGMCSSMKDHDGPTNVLMEEIA
jgi:hypothetical protein